MTAKNISPHFISNPQTEEIPEFGEFNTPDTEVQFVHSYGVYFEFLTENSTSILVAGIVLLFVLKILQSKFY